MNEEELREAKRKKLTESPVRGLICRMAVPTIVSMLVTALYNMADTFFMGQIDKTAQAAVGVIFSLMALIQAVGFFFGHGSGNYISRKLGARENEDAERMAAVGFFTAFAAGIVIAAAGLIFLRPLARMLGAIDSVLPYAVEYMRIILIGAPFMTSSLVLNNQLRLQGNALYAMFGIGAGAVLNIALDPLLIFVFHMGISGAALATTASQITSFSLLLICYAKNSPVKIRLKNFRFSLEKYLAVIQGGLPSLCRQGLSSLATILLNRAVGGYGDAALAAISIVSRVTYFAYSALLGFGQGFQPVCGFNYGAKLYGRVRQAFNFCVLVTTCACMAFTAIMLIFADPIIAVFCKGDGEVLKAGVPALRWQSASFPLLGFVVMSNMLLQNINKYKRASLTAAARQGLFFIPPILILPRIYGYTGVLVSQPIADALTFLLSLPIILGVMKELKLGEKKRIDDISLNVPPEKPL